MCIDSNKRLPLLLATAIVGMVNICNAVPAVGAPMPADSNAVSFVGISRDAEGAHAVDVGDGTYGFAGLTAETGLGIAAGVAVGIHGSDVATAGFYTMVNGVPQDTLTSQGLQAAGIPRDWANGLDAAISVGGSLGIAFGPTAIRGGNLPRVVNSSREPTITLYHGGSLNRGTIHGRFSTTPDYSYAQLYAERQGGKVYEFRVPEKQFNQFLDDGLIQPFKDTYRFSNQTGDEFRFYGQATDWLNSYLTE